MNATSRQFSRTLLFACMTLAAASTVAHGQSLVANDDSYGVPFGLDLEIEAPGVLENDTLDGEAADEGGATAELLADVSHGTLTFNTDGSFIYSPDSTFDGSDTFTYRAVFEAVFSATATVTLTACDGGPQIFTCWKESSYLAKAAQLGFSGYQEGFESEAAWGSARSPSAATSVLSLGTVWTTNHPHPPASNQITTGTGPALTGQYGVFDSNHGYATGTPGQCDIDDPPPECLFHDGFTGRRQSDQGVLNGAGGFFTGTSGANIAVVLDGGNEVGLGRLPDPNFYFFGVIDAGANGFSVFEFREVDGKVGQERRIFADDFTILTDSAVPVPALPLPGLVAVGCLVMISGAWLASIRSSSSKTRLG